MRPGIGALAALVIDALAASAAAKDGRKIFVSVDMEGVAGVVSNEQLGPPGFEYERFRQFMTEETNAAIFHSAKTLTPEAARDVIRDRVKAAMARRASFRPYMEFILTYQAALEP